MINTALWHYLDTKIFNFRLENNSTPGVLIEEIRYLGTYSYVIVISQYEYDILVITQVWGEAEDAGNN